jgi:hypothetical protein
VIADVPSSGSLAGLRLQGQLILEVPIQNAPIPKSVLKAADEAGVIIKEVATEIYKK